MVGKRKGKHTPVESHQHKDRRPNIPTEELRDFVTQAETSPSKLLYPRDPSLDPQLVWKGKDEQDREDLAVPVAPVYIQEKIKPQALIENLRDTARRGEAEPELSLFDDFDGLEFDDLIEFYQHDQNWSNRMILGDALPVMASLAEKEGFKGKVQMIYLDPPYGIKFGSNWQVSTRKRDVKDGKAEDTTRQPEQIKAFRDTWELGIHSYLAYLRDRLTVARELLTESGSVFVQIGDENLHLVRSIIDEVMGSDNFAGMVAFYKTSSRSTNSIPSVVDYIVIYAKRLEQMKFRELMLVKKSGEKGAKQYTKLISPNMEEIRSMTEAELSGEAPVPEGWRVCRLGPTTSDGYQKERTVPYLFQGEEIAIRKNLHWKYDPRPGGAMDRLAALGRLRRSGAGLSTVLLAEDNPVSPLDNVWLDTGTGSFTEDQVYVVQTANKVLQRCLLMATDPGDLVLDPTCGSGTTAYVAEQWGRRWITIDTSRVAMALARTRLMAAKYPYYLLADSAEGRQKESECSGQATWDGPTESDVKKGFVYKRVPHVTLKSIANNPEIREGMSREEIDEAIARHADTELLYDQPYEDSKRIRVTGPFTVESLSPHRVLPTDQQPSEGDKEAEAQQGSAQFEVMILDNLRKAGVQNTIKDERLKFARLEPYAGTWLHGTGEYGENGSTKRVAISIGPENGTVGPQQVKEAAKEAVQGVGFDLLVVCGFAFDPHVAEEAKRYGNLTVLIARMNPDLAMGEELLKKTANANLFMVFGEPDLAVESQADGKLVVEVKGLDVYDPTTGQIRSDSTDDIACWFIDTNYNGESFFVRQAYFTGADEPYKKLQRALKAEIDEAAWASLYSTRSRPFDPPETGKIAVKVINHYGDEVLKVYL